MAFIFLIVRHESVAFIDMTFRVIGGIDLVFRLRVKAIQMEITGTRHRKLVNLE